MKRRLFALLCILVLLISTACAPVSTESGPDTAYDLSYDMGNFNHFAEIFEENSPEEWAAKGQYTIRLNGLHTPVFVDMDGMDVLSVRAYDQNINLDTDGCLFQDMTPVDIRTTADAVVVNISWDYDGKTVILTKDQCYTFQPQDCISTQIFVQEDGCLRYYRYWGEYVTSFNQWDYAPLDLCTGRDQFLYEKGLAELVGTEFVLTPEQTVTVSDEYDLDAMFAEAKAAGQYEEYQTADECLEANKDKNNPPID